MKEGERKRADTKRRKWKREVCGPIKNTCNHTKKRTVKQKRQGPNNAPATKQNICGQVPHLTPGPFDPYVAQGSDPMVSDPMVSDMSAHVHKNIHSSGSNIYIYISTPPHKEETLLIKRVS